VVARSADVAVDAATLVASLTADCGGRGGGRPELAQGGVAAGADIVIARARRWLAGQGC
jgi:alanyl-tRNA synthetase